LTPQCTTHANKTFKVPPAHSFIHSFIHSSLELFSHETTGWHSSLSQQSDRDSVIDNGESLGLALKAAPLLCSVTPYSSSVRFDLQALSTQQSAVSIQDDHDHDHNHELHHPLCIFIWNSTAEQ